MPEEILEQSNRQDESASNATADSGTHRILGGSKPRKRELSFIRVRRHGIRLYARIAKHPAFDPRTMGPTIYAAYWDDTDTGKVGVYLGTNSHKDCHRLSVVTVKDNSFTKTVTVDYIRRFLGDATHRDIKFDDVDIQQGGGEVIITFPAVQPLLEENKPTSDTTATNAHTDEPTANQVWDVNALQGNSSENASPTGGPTTEDEASAEHNDGNHCGTATDQASEDDCRT